ncbi:c-type cytochrome [Cupriavidus consociatus]|uniref:c-type cytochrome n=1 Tax=Cupriavidus consociatus TaxID=2821357 RepID=UPI001AEA37CA|nr:MULTISPECIES: cytochrome c [unclassified Cupriavidus]MBP0619106.1 cytochrome c [Cupriavidus sp. LEh25]MDK2655752.1 cytochrome c [Cupriavidus sp. LEh21]
MNGPQPHAWLNALLVLAEKSQLGLLWLWHALGLSGTSHGQPAWPWARRIAGETLLIDLPLARQVGFSLCALAFAVLALVVALAWRRGRPVLLVSAGLALLLAPWPEASLLLGPASPTSFHASPTRFAVDSIVLGQRTYARHCTACHGNDGRGEGPLAASLPQWPPTLVSPLLARRAEGELFWHVLSGMRDRRGRPTMPAFRGQLADREAWAVIDYMKALSAANSAEGNWPVPLRLPEMAIRCGDAAPVALSQWRGGQRVRLVAVDGTAASLPYEDPRFLTVLVTRDGRVPAQVPRFRAGCTAAARAWEAMAAIAGLPPAELAGTQLLADSAGWLRARGTPGTAWSDADLVCVSGPAAAAPAMPAGIDGLTALLLRMDAEPVRFVKGGFIH